MSTDYKALLREYHPDIEKRPARHQPGESSIIMGECVEHPHRPAILFVLRVSERVPREHMARQGVRAGESQSGSTYPRITYVTTRREYRVIEWNALSDGLAVRHITPSIQQAREKLHVRLDAAT